MCARERERERERGRENELAVMKRVIGVCCGITASQPSRSEF